MSKIRFSFLAGCRISCLAANNQTFYRNIYLYLPQNSGCRNWKKGLFSHPYFFLKVFFSHHVTYFLVSLHIWVFGFIKYRIPTKYRKNFRYLTHSVPLAVMCPSSVLMICFWYRDYIFCVVADINWVTSNICLDNFELVPPPTNLINALKITFIRVSIKITPCNNFYMTRFYFFIGHFSFNFKNFKKNLLIV